VDRNNLWFHFARFAATLGDLDPSSESFEPVELPHPELRIRVLKGRRIVLVWCRDAANTWKSELEEGQSPQRRVGLKLDLSSVLPSGWVVRANAYDPWADHREEVEVRQDILLLPAFSRSIALRLSKVN
jgi:hypothetical protein